MKLLLKVREVFPGLHSGSLSAETDEMLKETIVTASEMSRVGVIKEDPNAGICEGGLLNTK